MSFHHSNSVLLLVLATNLLLLSNAQLLDGERMPSISSRKYCGKHLANTLQLVCNGVYNSMFKRNGQELEMTDYTYEDYNPFLRSRSSAIAMIGLQSRLRRNPRGIHDECCLKSCSLRELSSYCGS